MTAPQTHLIAVGAFGLVGWGVYELEGKQCVPGYSTPTNSNADRCVGSIFFDFAYHHNA